jgi:hypothetical protein
MSNVAAAATHAVVVSIGGMPIHLFSDDLPFLATVQGRYTGFLSSGSQSATNLFVTIAERGIPHQIDIRVERNSGQWSAERADFRLDWDPQSRSGRIEQRANIYSLDSALRILHTILLAEQGGFLLHAASAILNGRAHLFFGPSGAGKTTITRAAPRQAILLTDEISYVRGDGEKYLAYGTPFTGELAKSGENISAPIAALYYLVKAPTNRLTLMKPADAVRVLLESVLFFAEDRDLVNLLFASVCDLIGKLPVYQLEFAPGQGVWDLVQ